MGIARTTALILAACGMALAQTRSAQELTTERIRNMVRSEQSLETMSIPLLARMGDGAAAEILKVTASMGTLTARQQENIVVMIHKAFENVSAITQPGNKAPQNSEALLDKIAAATQDFSLKLKIVETRQFAEQATSRK